MAELEAHSTQEPESFVSFRFLPTEVRLQIWEDALPAPRVVEVHYNHANRKFMEMSEPVSIELVQVNREAREVVFKKYLAFFGSNYQDPLIYANPKIDIFKIKIEDFIHWAANSLEFAQVHYLELSGEKMHKVSATFLTACASSMPNLKQLIVVDPRCPFVSRPLPPIPTVPTVRNILRFLIATANHQFGQDLERQHKKTWNSIVEVDRAARLSHYGMPNVAVGMVAFAETGERRFKMVCRDDHKDL